MLGRQTRLRKVNPEFVRLLHVWVVAASHLVAVGYLHRNARSQAGRVIVSQVFGWVGSSGLRTDECGR